jgi:hypothetical protein
MRRPQKGKRIAMERQDHQCSGEASSDGAPTICWGAESRLGLNDVTPDIEKAKQWSELSPNRDSAYKPSSS